MGERKRLPEKSANEVLADDRNRFEAEAYRKIEDTLTVWEKPPVYGSSYGGEGLTESHWEEEEVLRETLEARRIRYREMVGDLTLMSDAFMRNVLKEKACTEYILQIIMENSGLKVLDQTLQKDYKNLQGRSAILDCVACDESGNYYNVEIQQASEGASPKRARYHSGLLDMNLLRPGQEFDRLPESCVIFITREDVLKKGFPVYHIHRKIKETGELFEDEAQILYVNASQQSETKLGRLMHDFHCKRADEMYSQILADRVRELKETEEGVNCMSRELDMLYREGVEFGEKWGEKRGERRARFQTILRMMEKLKMSPEEAMDFLEIDAGEREVYRRGLQKPLQ